MRDLSLPLSQEIIKSESGWTEVYDFYLPDSILTPYGTNNTIRITNLGVDLSFFAPNDDPEPEAGRSLAQTYHTWSVTRERIQSTSKFQQSQLSIAASNLTGEWEGMLGDVDWEGIPVIIRKVPISVDNATAFDCAVIYSGQVEKAKITDRQIEFILTNGLGSFGVTLPRQNMHTNCRFNWGDDMCTALKFLPANCKTGTVGAGSTKRIINSANFSEDGGNPLNYGVDLVDALPDGSITASSDLAAYTNKAVTFVPTNINDGTLNLYNCFTFYDSSPLGNFTPFTFGGGSVPLPFIAGQTYYRRKNYSGYYSVSTSPGGPEMFAASAGFAVTLTTTSGFDGFQVKASHPDSFWQIGNSADWGTIGQGYWQITDAQSGLANPLLKPYLTFDFGVAVQPKLWRIRNVDGYGRDGLTRAIQIHSSPDLATWTKESEPEIPPDGSIYHEILNPGAASARYWRICIRSRWSETFFATMLRKVEAYAGGRHYWRNGFLRFADATTTAALQGVKRMVLESYSGQIIVPGLPVEPAPGDTFTIKRGCGRSRNNCSERRNLENLGGFDSMPYQTIVR